ncbi:hypothetical protein CFOL_v3_15329 [Cephalotus follicularis]|uniref:Uncharacterized protein n=1 Tax=Cephalotus follicularis TaxID=3775 RepID=A0A1Q3BV53_CEPFO|nr:hypothetical protein CFOL_v3_15329 [Cephalotus follicularis]
MRILENNQQRQRKPQNPKKEKEIKLTSTVGNRGGRDFASSREICGLGDIQNNTITSTGLESLTETLRICLQHSLQARATSSLWLCHCASILHIWQAICHGQHQTRTIHCWCWGQGSVFSPNGTPD